MIWPAWFDHLEESFSYKVKKFSSKRFARLWKPAENVNESPTI